MSETENSMRELYFKWMHDMVEPKSCRAFSAFTKLAYVLDSIPFTYTISGDGNRYEDGIKLRYRFGYEEGYPDSMIAALIDICPCSVFEMMVALALKETEIVGEFEEHASVFFGDMLRSLELYFDSDPRRDGVVRKVNRFLEHGYSPNGKGGLFTLKNSPCDLRNTEIWYQMCRYLEEKE